MSREDFKILSTKILGDEEQTSLAELGVFSMYDAVITKAKLDTNKPKYKNVIFTSYNGAKYGVQHLGEKAKDHHFYCIGKKSEQFLQDKGLEVYGFANYSEDLANLLVENLGNASFSYLCSEQRLDNLPNILRENDVQFEEIYTYTGEANPEPITGKFDVYLWFSPKGVETYNGDVNDPYALHICIGKTTAGALEDKYSTKTMNITYPEVPSREAMIEIVMTEYKKRMKNGFKKMEVK